MQIDVSVKIIMAICAMIGGIGQAFMSGQELYNIAKDKKEKTKTETAEVKTEIKNEEI